MVCDNINVASKANIKMCKNQLYPRLRKLNLRLSFSQGKFRKK
eukprot:08963.XXX_564502_564630_1 [CDS] Oithona nana genome sequencing.